MTSNSAAVRTAVQAAIGFIAGGFLTEAWNIVMTNHEMHPTVQGLLTLAIVYLVTVVQNERENNGVNYPVVTRLKNERTET